MSKWQIGWTVVTIVLMLWGAFRDRIVHGGIDPFKIGIAVWIAAMTYEQYRLHGWIS